jgi:hypothetical protein
MMFKVGDTVTWTSQSLGFHKTKCGVVVATAPSGDVRLGTTPLDYAKEHFPAHKLMFDGLAWEPNGVLVEVRDGKTARAKPKLYMPRFSGLEKA